MNNVFFPSTLISTHIFPDAGFWTVSWWKEGLCFDKVVPEVSKKDLKITDFTTGEFLTFPQSI